MRMKDYARAGKLNQSNFHMLLRELRLNTDGLEDDHSPLMTFYRQFRDESWYEERKLRLLSVLLCQGSITDKAGVMFDTHGSQSPKISLNDITDLIEDLLVIAVDFLPVFSVRSDDTGLSQKCCVQFSLSLGKYKDTIRDRLTNNLLECKSTLTREEFIVRVEEDDLLRNMLDAKKLRRLLQAEGECPYSNLPF